MPLVQHPSWDTILSALANTTTSEVVINGYNEIFVRSGPKNTRLDGAAFSSVEDYENSIASVLIPLVQTEEEYTGARYLFEGKLAYRYPGKEAVQSRCHIGLPPLVSTPQITMTRRSESLTSLDAIATNGSMSADMYNFLVASVKAGLNIVLSGSSGSGKDLHVDTPILTANRGMCKIGTLEVGDLVFTPDGRPTKVLNKYAPMDETHYSVKTHRYETINAGQGHLWLFQYEGETVVPARVYHGESGTYSEQLLQKGGHYLLETAEAYRVQNLAQAHSEDTVFSIPPLSAPLQTADDPQLMTLEPNAVGERFGEGSLGEVSLYQLASPTSKHKLLRAIAKHHGETKGSKTTIKSTSFKLLDTLCAIVSSLAIEHSGVVEIGQGVFSLTWNESMRGQKHYVRIERLAHSKPEEFYCIEVEDDGHMFLCGKTCVPTHNTTMLGAMASFFDFNKRVGVAEDIPELVLPTPNTTYWCSFPEKPGRSADDVATLEYVVKQFQRNRCDQLLVGETRGPEFFSFLTAANSGLSGCMTTLHADNPVEALAKMSQFATQGAPMLPVRAINQKIAVSVDLIVQITRSNGRYRTTHIQEVVPVLGDTSEAKITTATLYAWNPQEDMFYKDNTVSDAMRKRFADAGQDISAYHLLVPSGKLVPSMGKAAAIPTDTTAAAQKSAPSLGRRLMRPGSSASEGTRKI